MVKVLQPLLPMRDTNMEIRMYNACTPGLNTGVDQKIYRLGEQGHE